MGWTDGNEPTVNNEPTSHEGLELTFAKLQKKYEENNELLRPNSQKSDRLEETMNNMLNGERTANKGYRSKTLKDIENKIKRQRALLTSYTQERIQTTMDLQVKKLHRALLDQRNQEQKEALTQRSMDTLVPLRCLVLTLLVSWLIWGE